MKRVETTNPWDSKNSWLFSTINHYLVEIKNKLIGIHLKLCFIDMIIIQAERLNSWSEPQTMRNGMSTVAASLKIISHKWCISWIEPLKMLIARVVIPILSTVNRDYSFIPIVVWSFDNTQITIDTDIPNNNLTTFLTPCNCCTFFRYLFLINWTKVKSMSKKCLRFSNFKSQNAIYEIFIETPTNQNHLMNSQNTEHFQLIFTYFSKQTAPF